MAETYPQCKVCKSAPMEARRGVEHDGTTFSVLYCPRCEEDLEHLYKLTADDLRFCGCGCPEDAYNLVRDILALAPFRDHREELRALIGGGDGAFYLVLYVLDSAGLIDHGTSIDGSWITKKGSHYLALMQRHGFDDFDQEYGYPHEGNDCPPSCRHWQASHEDWEKQRPGKVR